jgi:hypothetical protein
MDLSYPIGKFDRNQTVAPDRYPELIAVIAGAGALFRAAVAGLTDTQLDTPYRPDGWTVRQVIHHVADSHANAYVRFRMALTEDEPTIKPYKEKKWAELPDASKGPIEVSLTLIDALHTRLSALMKTMKSADFQRTYRHPEDGVIRLELVLAMYAWHCRHHAAHITSLRQRNGW